MNGYIKGYLKYFFKKQVSNLSLISNDSFVSSKAVVSRGCKVYRSFIDDYSYCAPNTELVHCHIGKYCSIGKFVAIGLANHTLNYLSTSPVFTETHNRLNVSFAKENIISSPFCEVIIGNDVWIGDRVIIKGGIEIGNGSVIGAGAVVTKNVQPYSIIGGVPGKLIRKRFSDEIISCIEHLEWWDWDEKKIKEYLYVFQRELRDSGFMCGGGKSGLLVFIALLLSKERRQYAA